MARQHCRAADRVRSARLRTAALCRRRIRERVTQRRVRAEPSPHHGRSATGHRFGGSPAARYPATARGSRTPAIRRFANCFARPARTSSRFRSTNKASHSRGQQRALRARSRSRRRISIQPASRCPSSGASRCWTMRSTSAPGSSKTITIANSGTRDVPLPHWPAWAARECARDLPRYLLEDALSGDPAWFFGRSPSPRCALQPSPHRGRLAAVDLRSAGAGALHRARSSRDTRAPHAARLSS